ncbi:unnamed protein product, partial [Ectocarpus sp. 4 AP-2014]
RSLGVDDDEPIQGRPARHQHCHAIHLVGDQNARRSGVRMAVPRPDRWLRRGQRDGRHDSRTHLHG